MLLTLGERSLSRAAKALSLPKSALEYARVRAEIPGVSVARVVLVGHGVLVGDDRPRSKTQPKEEGAARSRPLWS